MSLDIGHILKDWPFRLGEVNVRRIVGDDGREKIQLRLDLGLLQMEAVGRPDGKTPEGFESLLSLHRDRLENHRRMYGTEEGFELNEEQCEAMRAESSMYYHRYLAAFVLGDYETVCRDTQRNLEMFDFCGRYAARPEDRDGLEQYRPYVMMMYSRGRARQLMKQNRLSDAAHVVSESLEAVQRCYEHLDSPNLLEASAEITILRALEAEILAGMPRDPRQELHEQLQQAIEEERYEDAAAIRDALRKAEEASENPHAAGNDSGNGNFA